MLLHLQILGQNLTWIKLSAFLKRQSTTK